MVEDAERSIRLLSASLAQTGFDPETGKFDIDMIYTGMAKSQTDRIREIMDLIRDMEKNGYPEGVPHDKLIEKAKEHKMDVSKVEKELLKLRGKNDIYEPKNGLIKPTA
jgi:replicative DNA helicase Mcm